MLNFAPLKAPPLNQHYEGEYTPSMMEWRRLGAADKARNIVAMLDDRPVERVLEVGCGTGAVLRALQDRAIGKSHHGVDMADPDDHAELGIDLRRYDGKTLPFDDDSFDFVYATHVLEHVTDERAFLGELARVSSKWIYVEVPCELHLRTSVSALQTTLNIGHINAYTPESLALTLTTSGLSPIALDLFDHSLAVHGFFSNRLRTLATAAVRRTLLRLSPIGASRLFCYHCGALCTPG